MFFVSFFSIAGKCPMAIQLVVTSVFRLIRLDADHQLLLDVLFQTQTGIIISEQISVDGYKTAHRRHCHKDRCCLTRFINITYFLSRTMKRVE